MLPGMYSGMGGDPDIFVTNFGEYVTAAQPADWTSRWVTTGFTALVQSASGSLSGKALRWTKASSQRNFLSWDRVPQAANIELLMRWRAIAAWTSGNNIVQAVGRASGAAASEQGYRATAAGINTGTLATTRLNKLVAGTSTDLGTPGNIPSPNLVTNAWMWTRYRINGTSLGRKTWHDGAAEPGAFDETLTDTDISGAGWVGIGNFHTDPTAEVDYFGVALIGKTVPILL